MYVSRALCVENVGKYYIANCTHLGIGFIYFVHYLDPLNDVEEDESGILSSLAFWKDEVDKSPEEFYYIKLISDADKTKIVVLDAQEIRTSSDTAKRLLTLMQEQLSQ